MFRFHPCRAALMAGGLALSAAAQASCGASSCNLLNDRFALGTWEHTGWSADVRLEWLDQNHLQQGSRPIGPAQLPAGEEALERHTRQQSLTTTLDYAASATWSFALRLPGLRRDHLHERLDEDSGAVPGPERWRFGALGDAQLLARWQAPAAAADSAWALSFGLKLPTGSHTLRNAEGTLAERALQPGSGTTDLILGASARWVLGLSDALNLQATWQHPLAERAGFRPGQRLALSLGWAHAMAPDWSLLLQGNLSRRGRDTGAQAEPGQSGATMLALSPGVSLALGPADNVYALLQWPVHQQVDGVQLVPRAAAAMGWTHAF